MSASASDALREIDETISPAPWWVGGSNIWGPDGDQVAACYDNLALRPASEGLENALALARLRNALPAARALVAELEIVLMRPVGTPPDEKDLAILREALAAFSAALRSPIS